MHIPKYSLDYHSRNDSIITYPQTFKHKEFAISFGQDLLNIYPVVVLASTLSKTCPRKIITTLSRSSNHISQAKGT